ncbi:MAG: chemotaxis protein CheW [Candidatus Eremiobacteraeota bacterium]|nr:chemotaxis protein CheW [Candidatus Eremiobacteraeota bacterium]
MNPDEYLLRFEVCDLQLGLRAGAVQEIVACPELALVPESPDFVSGVLNYEGLAVPVVCAARLWGLSIRELDLYSPLLILRGNPPPFALQVHRAHALLPPESWRRVEQEHPAFAPCVEALVATGESGLLTLLCEVKLLQDYEQAALRALQERAQSRLARVEAARDR